MSKRFVVLLVFVFAAFAATAQPADSSPSLIKGIYDEPETLYGNRIEQTFDTLDELGTKAIRVNLYWGGKFGASRARPVNWRDPDEPGKYNWGIYDRVVLYAAEHGIKVIFSIYGTPKWANGGKAPNVPPKNFLDLQRFAYTAAFRYSGAKVNNAGLTLPPVRHWTAWNEPNNPVFLKTQYKRAGSGWIVQSAKDYAKICNAVYTGVHSTLLSSEKVACGVTAPRGNNAASSSRPSVSPLAFLRAMKKYGAKRFDAYAHHPYYGNASEEPGKAPPSARGSEPTAVTLGNIGALDKELRRLYGPKRIWITEYGYQTNPPDRAFGVSFALQAKYLKQAYAIARKHPRIDMMIWFLLRDEPRLNGWQSGFYTAAGRKKPAFNAFRLVP